MGTIPGHNVAILHFISLYLLIEIYLIKYSLNFTFQELFPNYLNDLANLALDDPDNWLGDRLERYRGHLQFIDLNLTDKNETDSVERKFKNVLDTVYNFDEDNKKILKDFLKKKIDQDNTDKKKEEEEKKEVILNRIWTEIKLAFQYLPIKSKNENDNEYIQLTDKPSKNYSIKDKDNEITIYGIDDFENVSDKLKVGNEYYLGDEQQKLQVKLKNISKN